MLTYLGILIGVPLAFCLFGNPDYPDLFHARRWSAVLSSGFASFVTLLAIWFAIGPGPWSSRIPGSILVVVVGFLIAFTSYAIFEPVFLRRVHEYERAMWGIDGWRESITFTTFSRELLHFVPWFAATACAMLAVRCWFGWLFRRTAEPVGRRNARRVRMVVLLSIVTVALATHLCLQLGVFGDNQQAAQTLVLMTVFFTVPSTFLVAAVLWVMFSNGRRKTRGTAAALIFAVVLVSYAFASLTMFRYTKLAWLWRISIAVTFVVPLFAALFAIRGLGYRITPYNRSDFLSAEAEQSLSPFDD